MWDNSIWKTLPNDLPLQQYLYSLSNTETCLRFYVSLTLLLALGAGLMINYMRVCRQPGSLLGGGRAWLNCFLEVCNRVEEEEVKWGESLTSRLPWRPNREAMPRQGSPKNNIAWFGNVKRLSKCWWLLLASLNFFVQELTFRSEWCQKTKSSESAQGWIPITGSSRRVTTALFW